MIARDPKTGGYWVVRPDGAVYAYGGAPYLGPGPEHQKAWQIGPGEPVGPVVGIVDDGAGGYVLAADAGKSPGQPALYHMAYPASGPPPFVS